jgi:hypothetical protein
VEISSGSSSRTLVLALTLVDTRSHVVDAPAWAEQRGMLYLGGGWGFDGCYAAQRITAEAMHGWTGMGHPLRFEIEMRNPRTC